MCLCLFQAEDGIRDLVRSRGVGDVYKRQALSAGSRRVRLDLPAQPVRDGVPAAGDLEATLGLSLIHI